MENPFVTKGYAGPDYFCDRVKETQQLVELTTNGNNMALISPRRVGKTDLIHHCFQQPEIKERYYTFHIDIYATTSLRDFVNVFGRAILDELKPKGKAVWEGFLSVLRSLRSEITYDANNFPTWSLGLGDIDYPATTLDEIFVYLGKADKPCMVAIDEFQQITRYTDSPNMEATLRTYIQKCINATFIFSGSKRHLMGEIFTSPSRPFYQSVLIMNLRPISVEKYTEFAQIIDENTVKFRVWERGSGETLACGTGACAVTYACMKLKKAGAMNKPLNVQARGGLLKVTYSSENDHIYLQGPAVEVFTGEIEIPDCEL